jgi:hypothetical protein
LMESDMRIKKIFERWAKTATHWLWY